MMTDADFEGQLPNLFQEPSGRVDTARLKGGVLQRIEHEDRRRRVVVLGASLVGLAISGSVIAASGFMTSARTLARYIWTSVPAPVLPSLDVDLSGPWTVAVVGLLLASLIATRAVRDF